MTLTDLSTPSLLVEQSRLQDNLASMQGLADTNDVTLRPHVKTHKSVALARQQQQHGAEGLTVATVREAETFVEAGFDDVRVAYPVTGRDKHKRLQTLRGDATVSFTVDTVAGAEQASAVYEAADDPVDVLMEVDVGHGRCGVHWSAPEAAVTLGHRIASLPGLRLTGLLTHAGQAYSGPSDDETEEKALHRAARHERDRMLSVASALSEAGVSGVTPNTFEVSVGSTPSMAAFENTERDGFRVTEIRPGNYVMHDAMQVALGAASLDDCALTVLTTVISTQTKPGDAARAFVDAGKKVFTTDTGHGTDGYGIALADAAAMRPHPGLHVDHLSEEHGWLTMAGDADLTVGDRLRIVPNHACVTVASQDTLHVVDGPSVVDAWSVNARGW
ncbi:D-TA family PLP-dependent enzyme [Salinibacter grassmerensis]|uniref:D-TA family PLP-dependent enzyme n=1 Tax=Salinibacter grassmerensis TaxID=3040353 RepID=UPI0021E84DBB|nr:D-TA family PLP-dependent enzyme [Salinibacter grassmerensis]